MSLVSENRGEENAPRRLWLGWVLIGVLLLVLLISLGLRLLTFLSPLPDYRVLQDWTMGMLGLLVIGMAPRGFVQFIDEGGTGTRPRRTSWRAWLLPLIPCLYAVVWLYRAVWGPDVMNTAPYQADVLRFMSSVVIIAGLSDLFTIRSAMRRQ